MQKDRYTGKTEIGLLLFMLNFSAWLGLHVYGVFFHDLGPASALFAPVYIAVMSWLTAGLFITAHDAMHGSLAPGRPRLNAIVGAFVLLIYAGFSWTKLKRAHMRHHARPGTPDDPDFSAQSPDRFWPWYMAFMKRYFGLWQLAFVLSVVAVYYFVFGAAYLNIVLFYGAPAILSSAQLFYFGTYLPHRHDGSDFADLHNARTNEFSTFKSLITCFHFGYHHEHHLTPQAPWWRLPMVRHDRQERAQ